MARFNTKCSICNKTFYLTHIHHINGNHEDNTKENLLNVCPKCHGMIHTPKNYSNLGYSLTYRKTSLNDKQKEILKKYQLLVKI